MITIVQYNQDGKWHREDSDFRGMTTCGRLLGDARVTEQVNVVGISTNASTLVVEIDGVEHNREMCTDCF